jgi:hypothetical protein
MSIRREKLEMAEVIVDNTPVNVLMDLVRNTQFFEWAIDDTSNDNDIRESIKSCLYEDYAYVRPFVNNLFKLQEIKC